MVLLGKRIKELRNKYKYTQTELANMVGVTKSTIAAYENDTRQPSYEVLIKLANVFKVTIDSIVLNRSGAVLEVEGLNGEQIDLIYSMIQHFRKSNIIDIYLLKNAPELINYMKAHPDMTLEDVLMNELNKK